MAYLGNRPAESYASFETETFSVSATTNYTLSHAVTNENEIRLVINGVVQQPGSGKAYTASGTTLTLTSATVSGDVMYAVYLGRALQTVNPPNASVGTAQLASDSVTYEKIGYNANSYRNIIINGDMSQAQRATSTSSITSSGYHSLDRFRTSYDTAGTWTQSQSTDVPTGQGFAKSFKMDCTTANGSLSAGSFLAIQTKFEGQNLQYLKKGTSSAESLTLSFWVKSSKTGTHIANLYDADNNRSIAKSYTISSANTWEKKTLTYAGDTSGAFGNDNATSLELKFILVAGTTYTSGTLATSWESTTNANTAVGQVNLADSTSNDWYVTGIQLEAGTSASDFEFLPVDVNLQRCQRYYYLVASGSGINIGFIIYNTSSNTNSRVQFSTIMRANPTLDITTGTGYYRAYRGGGSDDITAFTLDTARTNYMYFYDSSTSSGTVGYGGVLNTNNSSSYIAADAEL